MASVVGDGDLTGNIKFAKPSTPEPELNKLRACRLPATELVGARALEIRISDRFAAEPRYHISVALLLARAIESFNCQPHEIDLSIVD
jgi:hypothetical protein